MGIKYRQDGDLAFLEYCTEEELQLLSRYLTHDTDGSPRFTGKLLSDIEFKNSAGMPDQYKRCWQLIAAELQYFGGDTLANVIRSSGVLYKEILSDICAKLNVKTDKKKTSYDMENDLLDKVISDAWAKMSEEQRKGILADVGVEKILDAAAGLLALQAALSLGGSASYKVSLLLANSIARMLSGKVGLIMAGGGVGKGMAVLSGPVGLAIATILTVPAISGAAYRVTVPAVIQIAYMRRACEERDRF